MKQGRITITYNCTNNTKVVVYPKNNNNFMYGLILERFINSKKFRDRIDKEIIFRILCPIKTKINNNELKNISDNLDNS